MKSHQVTSSSLSIFLFSIIFTIACAEIEHETVSQSLEDTPDKTPTILTKDCGRSYSAKCLKLDVVSFFDRLSEQDDLGLLPGVSVVRDTSSTDIPVSEVMANLARDFPHDADKRLDAFLIHKVGSYLNSHAISIRLFDPRTFEAARNFNSEALNRLGLTGDKNVEDGRGKKDKGMNGLMAGLMMMKGTLGAVGFGALALLAGKALMTGLMALMLSAIIGLKSLTSGGEKKTTYEIVSKPVYSTSHSHSSEEHHGHGVGHSGYARSLDLAQDTVQEAVRKYGNVRDRRSLL